MSPFSVVIVALVMALLPRRCGRGRYGVPTVTFRMTTGFVGSSTPPAAA